MSESPEISIVTPSFRGAPWLPLAIASVADQAVRAEHIVQDAGSDDGTLDWLTTDPRVRAFVEPDRGMYDAVNRGYRRARTDILAYLNCDEQYLPNALARVLAFFDHHPAVDIVFGDCLVTDATGKYVCERRSLTPQLIHTWTASNLAFLTAVTFIRRRVLDTHQLWFNADYREAGDQDWALRVVRAGVKTAVLPEFRGRGVQRALTAARLRIALERGCLLAKMDVRAGTVSHQNAVRCGFQVAYTRPQLVRTWPP